jgi:hypothetical protein
VGSPTSHEDREPRLGDMVEMLTLLHSTTTAEEMVGRLEYL